jgi:cyclase
MVQTALVLIAAALFAGHAAACEMAEYKRVLASPNVHVFEAAEGTTAVVNGNIVAVVGRDAILVVDTGQFPGIARRVVGELEALSKAPVRYVVNTHWHGDHLLANSVFREAYPDARIVAHPHTIERGAFFYTDYRAKAEKSLPAAVADMEKRRAASGSDDERLWIDRTLDCVRYAEAEVKQTRYVAPDTPLAGEMTVDLGGVSATIRHIGTGNTPGDLIVWVPEDRLVATGDMVVAPVPYAIGSDLEPWTRTLAELARLKPAVIVPGHGPVMRDDSYVRDVDALIASTDRQLKAMLKGGVSRADAAARLDTRAFRDRHVTTPMRRVAFEQFFVKPAIAKLWAK